MKRQTNLRLIRWGAFFLWLTGYRLYVFPGDVFYYLYYGFLDNFWPSADVCWTFRKVRQENRVDEMRRRVLKG